MADPLPAYDAVPDIGLLYDSIPAYAARLDTALLVEEAVAAGGPVLELGCGTGRTLLPIARAGIAISGVDSSHRMLARCRDKVALEPVAVRGRITLVESDITRLSLAGAFPLITAPFRVVQHLTAIEDQLRLFEAVARHLAPGGRFIFDVFNPLFRFLTADRSTEVDDTPDARLPDGRRLRRTARVTRVRFVEQLSETELIYYLSDPDGGNAQRYVQAFTMRWYLRHELEHLVARCGFRPVWVYGDFARGPLTDDAPDQVWCVERS